MKIVFTTKGETWESSMDARFGRSEMFLVHDETAEALECIKNGETETMEHGAGLQTGGPGPLWSLPAASAAERH